MAKQGLSEFINISRWMAAFFVLAGHVSHLILVDYKYVIEKSILCKLVYFLAGFGHEAVMVFFVISGYLVGALTLDKWKQQGPNIQSYASARISRIYTVLLPALVTGFALDYIGLNWFNASELYTNSAQYNTNSLFFTIGTALDLNVFFGNVFMLQGISVKTLGSNSPLWSLANEWWYYIIFALVGVAVTTANRNKKIVCAVLALLIAALLPKVMLILGGVWALGFLANAWINSNCWRPHPILGIGLFILVAIAARLNHQGDHQNYDESVIAEMIRGYLVGIAYVVALVSASNINKLPLKRFNQLLAEFSYTSYLTHFPAMVFIVAFAYQFFGIKFQVQPGTYGLLYTLLLILTLYAYSYVFSILTEQHTFSVRKKVDAYLGKVFKF